MKRLAAPYLRAALQCAIVGVLACAAMGQVSIEPPPQPPASTAPPAPAEAPALTTPSPAPASPATTLPSADSILQDLLREKGTLEPSAAAATAPATQAAGQLREGETIDLRTGRLIKNEKNGAMQFAFANAASEGLAYLPMGVIPSRRLASMEDASDFGKIPITFRILAEVTQYRGKSYLYIKPFESSNAAASSAAPATAPAAASQPGYLVKPHIDPVAPNAPDSIRLHEGYAIYNRVGRLVRDEKTGAELFVFDSDGKQMYDPPMGVVPCRYLAVIEDASASGTKPVKFRVSAEVTQYRGKNYLYFKFVQAIKDLNQGLGG